MVVFLAPYSLMIVAHDAAYKVACQPGSHKAWAMIHRQLAPLLEGPSDVKVRVRQGFLRDLAAKAKPFAAKDMAEDDGRGTNPNAFITEQQAIDLQAKAEEVGADKAGFLKFLKVNRLAELPASKYEAALQALKDKAQGAR